MSAHGDPASALLVPLAGSGRHVRMDGARIFSEAVRRMASALFAACSADDVLLTELDMVVPHQANGRIIEAMRSRLSLADDKIWNEIRHTGNTSSSSIPLALDTVLRKEPPVRKLGICAFGAGFTSGAALLSRS